jgi:hypothetical protein
MSVERSASVFLLYRSKGLTMSIEAETRQVYIEKEPWWVSGIKQLGLPTILLILLGFGAYNAAAWLGENVIKPLTERQIEFINQVDKSVEKITNIIEEHQKNNGVIAKELDNLNNGMMKLNETTDRNNQTLESIKNNLKNNNQ